MAQSVEQRIRNAWVAGSSPAGSFLHCRYSRCLLWYLLFFFSEEKKRVVLFCKYCYNIGHSDIKQIHGGQIMAGTFKGSYNSNNDSDRISEELYNAFNLDDFDDDREARHRARAVSRGPEPKKRSSSSRRKKRKKDRQLIVMAGISVLVFLLIAEILCGIFVWKLPAVPAVFVILLNLAIGLVLGPAMIIAPILIAAVELAAGVFAGQLLMTVLGVILLVLGQVFCHLLK